MLNEIFIQILNELEKMMITKGEIFRARAYKKGCDAIMLYPHDIHDINDIKNINGIGKSIINKLDEYIKKGYVEEIEKNKNNPIIQLTKVFGIGNKKANDLINKGIDTIDKLRENTEILTKSQKLGLQYLDDIEDRIPRDEITIFNIIFEKVIKKYKLKNSNIEIVGSYRRGAKTSGDIDVIITNMNNDNTIYNTFLEALISEGIICHILSRGNTKCLALGKVKERMRRIDILYTLKEEYAFALLYFTGSKTFNTLQRQRALDMNYRLNEHGIYKMKDGNKNDRVDGEFIDERSIFDLLKMEYRDPIDRINIRSIKYINNDIEEKLIRYKKDGVEYLKLINENELNEMIKLSNDRYYNNDKPIVNDMLYDLLLEYVKSKYPKNKVINEGHQNIVIKNNKTKLPYEMWSLNKIKPNTMMVDKWKSNYDGPYVITCKLDGVSGLYTTEGGERKLYTRGNGKYGQDISDMIPYLRLPKRNGLVIRGEFVISKDIFKDKYSKKFSNPRNFVSGLINQKKKDIEVLKDIEFVGYELIKPICEPSRQFNIMNKLNMNVLKNIILTDINDTLLSKILIKYRENYDYDIDGVVCVNDNIYKRTGDNPKHAFAFKMVMTDQIKTVKVLDVIWKPSKDGYLKPRLRIEPVNIGGARIEYTTGFNGKFIYDNGIGINSIVRLVRSGDVIPHILDVVKSTGAKMPDIEYIWNKTNVDIILKNIDNEIVTEKLITKFFKTINVVGLGSGNIKKLINAGYDTILKIIKMELADFLKIEGFKDKLSLKIMNGIKVGLQDTSLSVLLYATNIFGRGFGLKKIEIILDEYPNILIENISKDEKIQHIQELKGMTYKSAKLFVMNIDIFLNWIKESDIDIILVNKKKQINKENKLYGKIYVMSGFRDKRLEKILNEFGLIQSNSVTNKTEFVIVKDINQYTTKIEDAKKKNIPILTIDEFINKYNLY